MNRTGFCGGMDVSLMAQMTELDDENRRSKKLCVDAQMRAKEKIPCH
jgi:hypothetical protein